VERQVVDTKCLAKHYGTLSPWERFPLILAASARGDAQERDRLAVSAPRVGLRVQDYFGLAVGFIELSNRQFLELLDLAATYLETMHLAGTIKGESAGRAWDAVLALGYLFNVQLAGWRLFCAEHRFDPDVCWSGLPGLDRLRRAEGVAKEAAFVAEGFARWGERSGRNAPVPTAERIAAALRAALIARAEWWG
jgi:hypothetical protein